MLGDVANECRNVLTMIHELLQDALFAAIAAIGFSAISNPPRKSFVYCAIIAAVGHSTRFALINYFDWHIVGASTVAAIIIGILAVFVSPRTGTPAETYLFPALLPMIPGIYAYKCVGGLVMCLLRNGESAFLHYFYLFADNGLTCFFIILGMVVGATIPTFLMPKISFQATRNKKLD